MNTEKILFDKSEETFPSKKDAIFLAHCAVSPLYRNAAEAAVQFVRDMSAAGIAALPRYFQVMTEFRSNVAELLNTSPANVSYIHNTGEALSMIANGYPFSQGDNVVSYIHEYPSNHYPWVMQKRRGVELRLLSDRAPSPGYADISKPKGWSMEELEEKVTDRTRIVAVSHVQFTSGFAADLRELGGFCRERNIDLVVDCAQSLGCLPVYPEEFHLSAVVASGWKWLLGLKGSGLLYTSPEFREKITETMSGPALMKQGLDYLDHSWQPHEDGRKFEYSTLPWDHVSAMSTVIKEVFLQYPAEAVRDEVFRLQDKLLENLDREKVRILEFAENNRSGIIAAEPVKDYKEVLKGLTEAGIVASAPIGYIRLAPHFYNDDSQMIKAADAINKLL